ncbi:hypothetical protein GCM10017673_33970 [Streptosporangium violaceochromogenes]|nr:hypothetical protein GCM10017673_33970 [Streptosporangium violaceochromogenes]
MPKTTQKAPPSLAELRQRILDGHDVTPAEYAQARTIAELDELQALAEVQAAARQAEADRVAHVEQVKAEILSQAGDTDADQADADLIRDAAARIITRAKNRYAAVNHGIASLRRLGLTEGEEYAGATWKNASMGLSDAVIIDGRRIGQTPAGPALADALAGALADAGVQRGYLAPLIHVHGNAQPRQKVTQ